MTIFTHSKLNFIKSFFVSIVLLTSSINIGQTNERININSKAKELGITATELQGVLKSTLRNDAGSNPQPDSLANIIFTGEAAEDVFGISVSTAGDVNGDGYDDVVVGAVWYGFGGSHVGKSYIYFGGNSMDSTADVTMTADSANDRFGYSVSTAGDVNGDGYSDVIVGAYQNNSGGTYAGRSYIYFGGISMDDSADVTMTGEAASDYFGYSVSTAGDVNGDGYSDVIVCAHAHDSGKVYIYFGGISMDNSADVTMTAEPDDENHFGYSVSTAGDVNGDGYSDVIVGALYNDAGGADAGRSYIYFGGTSMDNIADVILTGEATGDIFGISVSTAGDVNGDGYSDVIVGATQSAAVVNNPGRSYIYFGGSSMDNSADVTMTGEAEDDYFGNSVSTAGDVNGDGYSDVIVGAPGNETAGYRAGRSYIYFGGNSMDNFPDVIMTGEAAGDNYGISVSTAGDVNGDGYNDVIVGAPNNDAGGNSAGRAYLDLVPSIAIWTNQIIVENAEGTEASEILTFGQHIDATDSIDTSLGEYILPPAPPVDIFDARFILPTVPEFGSLIDLRDSSQTEITWTIAFQAGSAGYPMTFSWDSTSFPDETFYLTDIFNGSFVNVNMKNQSSYILTEPTITSLYINNNVDLCSEVLVNNGWNMISVPYLAEDMTLSNLFPTATSSAYRFEGGYIIADTLAAGVGYWLKFGGNEGIQICGTTLGDTVRVKAGWNMIGPFGEDIPVSQITSTPIGIIASNFFGFEDGYNIADTLNAGKGYWVYVSSDGVINLNGGELAKGDREQIAQIEQEWGKILLTDATGINYTLYAVNGDSPNSRARVNLDKYELPPMPPAGIFDIRFSSGRIAEDINSSMQTIDMSGVTYPLTVRVEGMDIRLMDETGRTVNVNLKSGEDVVISDATIKKLVVSGGESIPTVYALEQNYPNPFNPSTVIEFSLPEDVSNVKLSIYNALGEKVAELVNSSLTAGKYQYQWNAKNVATGMYIYELRADNFVSIKKMILLK